MRASGENTALDDRSDGLREPAGALLWLDLDGGLSEEIEAWIRGSHRLIRAEDPLDLVSRLQDDRAGGLVLVSLGPGRLEAANRACSVCRRLRPGAPVVVISEAPVRASDRAGLLRAGADECMAGGLDVRGLASRLELARSRVPGRPAGRAERAEGSTARGSGARRPGRPGPSSAAEPEPVGGGGA